MGAWGYGPCDSDDAGDFFDELLKSKNATTIVGDAFGEENYSGTVRAAAHFLALIGGYASDRYLYIRQVKTAIQQLENLLGDEEWIGSWRGPKIAKRAIKKQVAVLKGIVKKSESSSQTPRRSKGTLSDVDPIGSYPH